MSVSAWQSRLPHCFAKLYTSLAATVFSGHRLRLSGDDTPRIETHIQTVAAPWAAADPLGLEAQGHSGTR